jgi:Tfp pilus assembly protein PilV
LFYILKRGEISYPPIVGCTVRFYKNVFFFFLFYGIFREGSYIKIMQKKENGIMLLEALLAVAVFAIGVATVMHLYLGSYISSLYSMEKNQAMLLAEEGLGAVRSIRDADFENITVVNDYGVEIDVNSRWILKDTPDIINEKFTRKIDIEEIDEETKKVTSTVSWQPSRGEEASVFLTDYLTLWQDVFFMEYELTTDSSSGGSITAPGEGSFSYDNGETANIIANPETGYLFSEWTGDVETVGSVSSASTTILMNNDYSIVANFVAE